MKVKEIRELSTEDINAKLKETKEELEYSLNNLSYDDNFVICSLYGIKTKRIT